MTNDKQCLTPASEKTHVTQTKVYRKRMAYIQIHFTKYYFYGKNN
jgi:hypothetical protein